MNNCSIRRTGRLQYNDSHRRWRRRLSLFLFNVCVGFVCGDVGFGVMGGAYGQAVRPVWVSSKNQLPDTTVMDEVEISVPFGRVKKSTFVGAASVVSAKQMQPRVVSSFANSLDGLVPGLGVSAGATRPGSSGGLGIRGRSSINSGSSPLVILNGVEYGGSLSTINPEDIQSVVVLKDASATALYGSRAANGVILVTTKTGKGSGQNISVSAKVSFGTSFRFIREFARANPEQYYQTMWEILRNNQIAGKLASGNLTVSEFDKAGVLASNTLISQLGGSAYNLYNVPDSLVVLPSGEMNPNAKRVYTPPPRDWAQEMIQTSLRQEHVASVSGSSNGTNFYVSAGYLNDPGIIFNSSFERYTFSTNIDSRLNQYVKIGGNMMFRKTQQGQAHGSGGLLANPFLTARNIPSIYPVFVRNPLTGEIVKDDYGKPVYDFGTGTIIASVNGARFIPTGQPVPSLGQGEKSYRLSRAIFGNSNAIATMLLDKRDDSREELSSRAYLEINPVVGLSFRSSIGVDNASLSAVRVQNQLLGDGAPVGGRTSRSMAQSVYLTLSNVLNYQTTLFPNGVDFRATVGHEFVNQHSLALSGGRTGFPIDRIFELSSGAVVTDAESSTNLYRLQGLFTRVRTDYRDRYFMEASLRADQSSKFKPGNQWGLFWSVGAGWDIAREPFFRVPSQTIHLLKISASYGVVGNDGTNSYAWQGGFDPSYANLDATGAIFSRYQVDHIRWESLGKSNLGLDLGLFGGRLSVNANVYYNPVKDMLFGRNLAPSLGVSSITENIGSMYNIGFEWAVTAMVVRARTQGGLNVQIGANGFWQKNTITRLPEEYKQTGFATGIRKYIEGGSIFNLYLRRSAGIDSIGRPMFYAKTGDKDATGKVLYETGPDGNPVFDQDGDKRLVNQRDTITTDFNKASLYILPGVTSLPIMYGGFHFTFSWKGIELYVLMKYRLGGLAIISDYAGLTDPNKQVGQNIHADLPSQHARIKKQGNKVVVETNGYPALGTLGRNYASDQSRLLADASFLAIKNITLTYHFPSTLVRRMGLSGLQWFGSVDNVAIFSPLPKGSTPEVGGGFGSSYAALRLVNSGIKLNL